MDITLETIDAVRQRSGASYQEAREALEKSGGDTVQALIELEYEHGYDHRDSHQQDIPRQSRGWGSKMMGEMRQIMNKGNEVRIRIGAGENTLLEVPVTLGALGAIFFPRVVAMGTVGLLMAHCQLELSEQQGEKIFPSH